MPKKTAKKCVTNHSDGPIIVDVTDYGGADDGLVDGQLVHLDKGENPNVDGELWKEALKNKTVSRLKQQGVVED